MPPPRPIDSLTEAVGLTPAARLRRHPLVVVKLESSAPEASLHDRAARALVAAGLPDGPLRLVGDGELAVALARELARLRRPLSVVLPEDVTLETAQSLEAWGAQVTRSPFAEGAEGAARRAGLELAAAVARAWHAAGAALAG
ncbi:MAG: pyridoxal-phosphate dependent enzyme, partial [Myxococcaceae bacterium]|nr:pyridoxal-phosphate dependent enzyme [Myxococcaceae bacterium]